MVGGRCPGTSHRRGTPSTRAGHSTRRPTYKGGNGGGAPALVGVVVTWETGDEKVAGSQRPYDLARRVSIRRLSRDERVAP